MAYPDPIKQTYQKEIQDIRDAGLFKEERFIHAPQAADITVEFPERSEERRVGKECRSRWSPYH